MRKCILTLSIIITIISFTLSAVAADTSFNDVSADVPFYEDIERLAEMGAVTGYDDGTFRPNENITVAEGITIAEKVLGDVTTLPLEWGTWFDKSCGWKDNIGLDRYYFRGDFSKHMCYETAAEVLIKLRKLPIIYPELWDMKTTSYNRYITTMYICGCSIEKNNIAGSSRAITRGEFCGMVSFMLDYDGISMREMKTDPIIKPELYHSDDEDFGQAYISNIQSAAIYVPDPIRRAFVNDGYKVLLLSEDDWNNVFDTSEKKVGFYSYTDKAVSIRMGCFDAIVHELGHYVHSTLEQEQGYDISTDENFKKELGIMKFLGDEYYMTSDAEFFAEAFALYCRKPETLQTKVPAVYEFIDKAVNTFIAYKN